MRRDQLEHAIRTACQIIEHPEVIVVVRGGYRRNRQNNAVPSPQATRAGRSGRCRQLGNSCSRDAPRFHRRNPRSPMRDSGLSSQADIPVVLTGLVVTLGGLYLTATGVIA